MGQDIAIKVRHEAENGGTIGRAKLGYVNVKKLVDGHKVNSVAVDEKTAPYVRLAFELFATGQHTIETHNEADRSGSLPASVRKLADDSAGIHADAPEDAA